MLLVLYTLKICPHLLTCAAGAARCVPEAAATAGQLREVRCSTTYLPLCMPAMPCQGLGACQEGWMRCYSAHSACACALTDRKVVHASASKAGMGHF